MRGGRFLGPMAALLLVALASGADAGTLQVVYPAEHGREAVNSYPVKLLELALKKSGRPFEMRPTPTPMNEARARTVLEKGDGSLTVAWFGSSRHFERRLLPVYVPIYRGLLGHRLFLINKAKQPLFSAVKTIEDLQPLLALQGQGWSDVEILSAAGLNVDTSRYRDLFYMLNAGRGDYFPRGVTEAFAELSQYGPDNPELAVERDLVLVYPFAMYYFVAAENKELRDAIRDGLTAAFDDGSFQALFDNHPAIAEALAKARLAQRRTIAIDNPLVTPETLAIPARYWYQGGLASPSPPR